MYYNHVIKRTVIKKKQLEEIKLNDANSENFPCHHIFRMTIPILQRHNDNTVNFVHFSL